MKLVFTLNPLVAVLLASSIDRKKVEQACESYRNRMTIAKDDKGNDKTKQERRLRIAGAKSSGFSAKERVSFSAEYIGDLNGESNVVARFIAYNDEITLLTARAAKVEADIKPRLIPLEFSQWLAKFDTKRTQAPASNGNGATPARKPRKAKGETEAPAPAENNRVAGVVPA